MIRKKNPSSPTNGACTVLDQHPAKTSRCKRIDITFAMEYLVRLVYVHLSFRRAELEAVATLLGIDLEILFYTELVSERP